MLWKPKIWGAMTPATPLDSNALVGRADVVFLILDTLRYDVAKEEFEAGRTPNLARLIGPDGWEQRHTPGSFTLSAHMAFFHGFFPTPVEGPAQRPFAIRFACSETIGPKTAVFEEPNIVAGFEKRGYRTVCIGGTGFFNTRQPLGTVLPGLFQQAFWDPSTSVVDARSTEHQTRIACDVLAEPGPVFLFVNISAIHQPNCLYEPGAEVDSLSSHAAALRYVDGALKPLIDVLLARSPLLLIAGSDHGTCYGEGGYVGHRVAHPCVWTVPWAERSW